MRTIKIIHFIAFLVSLFVSCKAQNAKYKSVDVKEFEQFVKDVNVVRLDVRTLEEYTEGHIPMSQNIDVKQAEFEQRALKSLPKDKTIAVYCRSGNRSKLASELLSKNGYKVVELSSGITGWKNAGKEVTTEEVDFFTTANGKHISIYCIKHGSLRINVDNEWIYVDPVVSAVPPTTDYSKMAKADYILITHDHHDHLDKMAIEQLSKKETCLLLNSKSRETLGGVGEVMNNGEIKQLRNFVIECVPAYNISKDKLQFHPKGRDNGYLLIIDDIRIYIAGDTEDIPEMKNIKDVDIAFLPCNLPYTMTPEQVAKVANTIKPHVLFPYHYGQTDILKVQKLLDGTSIDVRIRQYQ